MTILKNKFYIAVILLTLSFSMSTFSWKPMAQARLGLIDDHEIIEFIGSDKVYELSSLKPNVLNFINQPVYGRHRPTYYLLRHLETFLFQDSSTAWYISRIFVISLSIFLISYTIFRISSTITSRLMWYNPYLLSVLTVFVIVNFEFINDITTRLGPGEYYMFLLISLGLLTSYTCFRGNRVVRSFIFLNIIYFLGIGVKENFFIFLVLITYVLVKNWSRINSVGKFLFLLVYLNSIIWTMLYVVNILNEYFVSKSDIYGDSRDFTSTLIALTENRYFLYSIFPLFALLVIGVLNFWFNKNKVISLNLFRSSIVFGLLIFLSESFFYQHNIADLNFSTPRYSMFSALAFNLIFITALLKIQVEIQGVFERKNSRALIIALILTSVIFVYAIMTATYSTLFKYNQKSIRNSNQLKSEMNSILAGMDQLDVLSTNQVVVIVNGPWQYEYLYSIATYSQHYSKKKVNVFAEVQIDLDALETNFEQRLSAEMIKDSILGNSQNRNNIKPLSALKRNRPVVCLSMPGSVIPSFCTADLLINPYSRTW